MRLAKLLTAIKSFRPSPFMSAVVIGPAPRSILTTSRLPKPKKSDRAGSWAEAEPASQQLTQERAADRTKTRIARLLGTADHSNVELPKRPTVHLWEGNNSRQRDQTEQRWPHSAFSAH